MRRPRRHRPARKIARPTPSPHAIRGASPSRAFPCRAVSSQAQGEVERRIVSQLLTLLDGLGRDSRVMVVAGGPREQWLKPWTKLQSSA